MMLDILEIIRKTEAFLLPLLPGRWRQPPPSSRWIHPLLKRLKRYRKWPGGLEAFLESIRDRYYPAYHKEGWGDQLAPNGIHAPFNCWHSTVWQAFCGDGACPFFGAGVKGSVFRLLA